MIIQIILALGGLGLFLYGMKLMGEGLELAAGSTLRTLLEKLTMRITSEVKGVNRVLYDCTPKPTGTIEYE